MEYFLQPTRVDTREPPVMKDLQRYLEPKDMHDKPLYTTKIETRKINNRGNATNVYSKRELLKILRDVFGLKSVPGGKKSDVVRFLLEPGSLEKIEYNNWLHNQVSRGSGRN